jgi:hypothetical protein
MRRYLLVSIVAVAGILIVGCSKSSDTNKDITGTYKSGQYAATGAITLTAGGVNYSIPMKNVEIITAFTNQILINAQDTTVAGLSIPFIIIVINSPSSGITTGTYAIPGTAADAYTKVTYSKSLSQYDAEASITGSSATINITKLTNTTIQGTFTATVVSQAKSGGSDVVIANGIINCTY